MLKAIKRLTLGVLYKLLPHYQFFRPVMFPIYLLSIILLLGNFGIFHWVVNPMVIHAVTFLIAATVVISCIAETIALNRGEDQAESLKKTRQNLQAKKLAECRFDASFEILNAVDLKAGDWVLVQAGELIPGDGEVVLGAASVNESAVTGESAPVIRESGGDRTSVLAGTKVLSDKMIIKITSEPGQGFVDQMILMVEGAKRQKMPSELMLTSFLAALTALLVWVCACVYPFLMYESKPISADLNMLAIIALFVCLAPTTIGGLLPAISIAGLVRMFNMNVIAISGTAVEAAGNVGIFILDKTGTITLGNRQATDLRPANGVSLKELAEVALLTSYHDETAEGRSIVKFCEESLGNIAPFVENQNIHFIPFTAETRMSGAVLKNRQLRKGAAKAIEDYLKAFDMNIPEDVLLNIDEVSRRGGTPLVVTENSKVLGIIVLKDVIKNSLKERFIQFRNLGVRTIMVTGDNALTAAAIAAEAGVDDFLANAKPQNKLDLIREYQQQGYLVAMTGDGTNDAPALAQSDVGLVMNNGTQAAKEAGNLIDLDSDPTKLIDIIYAGKILMMTRGALTTFSICNDVAKYFALLPVILASLYPQLQVMNLMHLSSPTRAIIAALIANVLLMLMVVPLALKGISYHGQSPQLILKKNLLFYGLGGVLMPFMLIKLLDLGFAYLGYLA
ncbi:MAG TPA: K(+)-transporting ATPase subunit B [Legionellales bacterium]|nr:K(+)-transporting ATPase subunit B [Legionellales bacterium]